MYEDDFSFEFDAEYDVEEMIAALKEAMPRNLMTVLNISKFKEVIAIVNVIVASIRRQCDDAKFTMNFDRGFGIDIMLDVVSDYIGYSASKASSDHFVRAFHDTYGMPTVVTNCSNNYGPYQFPEKLIPLFINNIRHRKPLPVYGKGENVRDWLYVVDHARAIDVIFHKGKVADTYNIGGFNEWKNIDIIKVHSLRRL